MTQSEGKGVANQLAGFVGHRIERILSMPAPGPQKALLANLRRGVGKVPGELPALWGVLLEDFPEAWMNNSGDPSQAEWAAYIALTSFALHQQGNDPVGHPMHCTGYTIGQAVRRLVPPGDADAEARVMRRFKQLATTPEIQSVARHLRSLIQLLRAGDIPLDYAAMTRDLYQYQFPESVASVRLRWAQDFYRIPAKNKDESDGTNQEEEK